jgi:hypothetical protein
MNQRPERAALVKCPFDLRHQTAEHHAVCLSHVRHRYKITGPITIIFPGECGNTEAGPEWDEVLTNTVPVCNCGRDRAVFPPIAVHPEVPAQTLASSYEPIVLGEEDFLCIRSIAGSGRAHYAVAVEDGQLIIEADPIIDAGELLDGTVEVPPEPMVWTSALADLAPALAGGSAVLPFYQENTAEHRLVFAVTAIDVASRQVSITVADAMEPFSPDIALEAR